MLSYMNILVKVQRGYNMSKYELVLVDNPDGFIKYDAIPVGLLANRVKIMEDITTIFIPNDSDISIIGLDDYMKKHGMNRLNKYS